MLSLGPILCRGFANGPEKQHGSKNLILGFFVATVKLSVKAFEGLKRENAFISATRPSIKILSKLFTIQLLILFPVSPKISKKYGYLAKNGIFWSAESIIAYFFFSFTSSVELLVKTAISGQISLLI